MNYQYIFTHPWQSLTVLLLLATCVLAWFILDTRRKWNRVFGARARTPTNTLGDALQRLIALEKRVEDIAPRIATVEAISTIAVQKIGFMRFNPFEHTGGDQSFAIALLDRSNNGIVLSSLYTREGVRVYAKEIRGGASKHQLSREEQKVLEQAMNGGE